MWQEKKREKSVWNSKFKIKFKIKSKNSMIYIFVKL